jgi:hypothetical protein
MPTKTVFPFKSDKDILLPATEVNEKFGAGSPAIGTFA